MRVCQPLFQRELTYCIYSPILPSHPICCANCIAAGGGSKAESLPPTKTLSKLWCPSVPASIFNLGKVLMQLQSRTTRRHPSVRFRLELLALLPLADPQAPLGFSWTFQDLGFLGWRVAPLSSQYAYP